MRGVFVSGETDVTELTRFARLDECRVGPVFIEDAMWILIAKYLVVLYQIDAGLEATE
jgi:hypothetical protein